MNTLGTHLRRLRASVLVGGDSITQADFGRRLGLAQTTISDIERGTNKASAGLLSRWLDATDATDAQRLEALRLAGEPSEDPEPAALG